MEKTYKYTSVCEKEKPIQTNNPSTFIQHVASCATCKSKLPGSMIQALQPRLDQIIQKKKGAETSEEQKPTEERKLEESTPALEPLQQQFDGLMKESVVFQGIKKSVAETKTDVKKLSEQFDGLGDHISSQIASLGDALTGKVTGESVGEEGGKDAGEATEGKEAPGEVLSDDEEKRQQGTRQETWGKGDSRPNPFGTPDNVPNAMREGYQPGQGGGKAPGEKAPPEGKKPPLDEEPRKEEVVQKGGGGKGPTDLSSPEELKEAKKWVAEQEEKMGGGKKTETEKKEIPYIGDVTEGVRAVKEVIAAWRGEGGGEAGEGISFSKFAQELVLEMLKRQVAAQGGVGAGAGAGGQVMTLEHMNTLSNFLKTFFTGVKGLPKSQQDALMQGVMGSGPTESEAEETIH